MFRLNYYQPEIGDEYLEKYNVPVIKAIADYYSSPSEYNNSSFGIKNPNSVPSQVGTCRNLTAALKGSGSEEKSRNLKRRGITTHYLLQVDWLGNRAIGWAELGRTCNQDKKVVVIYYNHEGGKNNIGASYLDTAPTFTLLL